MRFNTVTGRCIKPSLAVLNPADLLVYPARFRWFYCFLRSAITSSFLWLGWIALRLSFQLLDYPAVLLAYFSSGLTNQQWNLLSFYVPIFINLYIFKFFNSYIYWYIHMFLKIFFWKKYIKKVKTFLMYN